MSRAPEPRAASSGHMPTSNDAHDFRVLVLTNMYPTQAEPDFGCFVRDQVDDLKALGVPISVLAFDGRPGRSRYVTAALVIGMTLRRRRFDLMHAHSGLIGA